MVVAEKVGQLVALIGKLPQWTRPQWLENLELMPKVLGLLAPLVQMLVGCRGLRQPERFARAGVRALHSRAHH